LNELLIEQVFIIIILYNLSVDVMYVINSRCDGDSSILEGNVLHTLLLLQFAMLIDLKKDDNQCKIKKKRRPLYPLILPNAPNYHRRKKPARKS